MKKLKLFIEEDLALYKEERISNFLKTIDDWIEKFNILRQLMEHSNYKELNKLEIQILTEKNLIKQQENLWQNLLATEEENYEENINLEENIDLEKTQSEYSSYSSLGSRSFCSTGVTPQEENSTHDAKLNKIEQTLQDYQNLITNLDYQEQFLGLRQEIEGIKNQIEYLKQSREIDLENWEKNEIKISELSTIILALQNKIEQIHSKEEEKINYLKRIEDQLAKLSIKEKPTKPPTNIIIQRTNNFLVCVLFIPIILALIYLYKLINSYHPTYNYRYYRPRPS